jgi:hypothetical protein
MRIVVPKNANNQLIDLTGCTVTFLGRPVGTRTAPPPIVRPIENYATETVSGVGDVIAVYIHFTAADTKAVAVPSSSEYTQMEGELEVVDSDGEVLTIPSLGYITWFIRDDIGDGV